MRLADRKAGEPLYISYCNERAPYEVRQKTLQESFFFRCHCTKCSGWIDPEAELVFVKSEDAVAAADTSDESTESVDQATDYRDQVRSDTESEGTAEEDLVFVTQSSESVVDDLYATLRNGTYWKNRGRRAKE